MADTIVMLQPGQMTPELAKAVDERRADLAKQGSQRLAAPSEAGTQPCPACDGAGRVPMAPSGPGFSGAVMPGMEPVDSDAARAAAFEREAKAESKPAAGKRD